MGGRIFFFFFLLFFLGVLVSPINCLIGDDVLLIYSSGRISVIDEKPQEIARLGTRYGGYLLTKGKVLSNFETGKKISLYFDEVYLEQIYLFSGKRYLILLLELSDGDKGWGKILKIDEKNFKVVWEQRIPTFNVGRPLFEEGMMYVSGIGMIGKIDLRTGQYVWKKDGLYKNNRFNSFWEPYREGADIIFEEQATDAKNKDTYQLRVNPETGEYRVEEVPTANR